MLKLWLASLYFIQVELRPYKLLGQDLCENARCEQVCFTHVVYLTGLQILWSYHLKKLWMGQWTNLPVIFQPPNLCGSWLNIILMLWTQSWRCGMRHGKFSHLIIVLLLGFKYIFSVSSPFQIAYNATPKARRKWKRTKKVHFVRNVDSILKCTAGIKLHFYNSWIKPETKVERNQEA